MQLLQCCCVNFFLLLQILLIVVPGSTTESKIDSQQPRPSLSPNRMTTRKHTTSMRSTSYYYMDNYYGQCSTVYNNYLGRNEIAYVKAKYPDSKSTGPLSSCVMTFSSYGVDDIKYKFDSSFYNSFSNCDATLYVYSGSSTYSSLYVSTHRDIFFNQSIHKLAASS